MTMNGRDSDIQAYEAAFWRAFVWNMLLINGVFLFSSILIAVIVWVNQ